MSTVANRPKRLTLFLQGRVVIPAWVDDLDSFCSWRLSEDAPDKGEMAFPAQGVMELEGTPDLVLEVVSKTSQEKDTVLLRELYARAGISEYWLVNVREGKFTFEILRLSNGVYVPTPAAEGWLASLVLGKRFQLRQQTDPLGLPQYFVVWE